MPLNNSRTHTTLTLTLALAALLPMGISGFSNAKTTIADSQQQATAESAESAESAEPAEPAEPKAEAEATTQLDYSQLSSPEIASKGLVSNSEAPIPPQCYTRTEGQFNPCYTCHQSYDSYDHDVRTNSMRDGGLQGQYAFSEVGTTNHWLNLFKDRTEAIAAISDEIIKTYIAEDNYSALIDKEKAQNIRSWAPDLANYPLGAAAFDKNGHAIDGTHWVAFNYKPLASTFWPTNGSTDDVVIRLSAPFRSNAEGKEQRDIYQANLALLEINMLGLSSVSTPPINEQAINQDLDGNGRLDIAHHVLKRSHYVGAASDTELVHQLYPKDTEFMHSVRYVGTDEQGHTVIPARMKELRYMKKVSFKSPASVSSIYLNENLEKVDEQLPKASKVGTALNKGIGWIMSAYIEDASGKLRQQTYEETFFCTGCHTSIGSTIDQTFSFARKKSGRDGWGYIDLTKLHDAPNRGEQQGEYLTYLERVGGGSEFRNNTEMQERWFNADGTVNKDKVQNASLYELITPSPERALQLNKAYKVIVEEQSFHLGRDATITPPENVYQHIDNHTQPLEAEHRVQNWDIRLDWNN